MNLMVCALTIGLGWAFSYFLSPPSSEEYATLVVYRKGDFGGPSFSVSINEKKVIAELKQRSYIVTRVKPGSIIFKVQGGNFIESKRFSMEVAAGKTYFLEAVVDYDFLFSSVHLVLRSPENAQKAMRKFKQDEKAKPYVD